MPDPCPRPPKSVIGSLPCSPALYASHKTTNSATTSIVTINHRVEFKRPFITITPVAPLQTAAELLKTYALFRSCYRPLSAWSASRLLNSCRFAPNRPSSFTREACQRLLQRARRSSRPRPYCPHRFSGGKSISNHRDGERLSQFLQIQRQSHAIFMPQHAAAVRHLAGRFIHQQRLRGAARANHLIRRNSNPQIIVVAFTLQTCNHNVLGVQIWAAAFRQSDVHHRNNRSAQVEDAH